MMAKAKKKTAKKTVKKTRRRLLKARRKLPAKQGRTSKRTDVGPGRPPVEHQFKPGQSGNPAGPPPARSNLWRWFCHWMAMTPEALAREKKRKDPTMSQRTALKQAEQLVKRGLLHAAIQATRRRCT